MSTKQSKRPRGYWTKENTILEARRIVESHGDEGLSRSWLRDNSLTTLSQKIAKFGGIQWIRQELGLEQGKRKNGYWTKENTILESKNIVEIHGPSALSNKWLRANGFAALCFAINNNGGYSSIRRELNLDASRKPLRYWSKQNIILEAKRLVEEHGESCLKTTWMASNGFSGLKAAILTNGGFEWIRNEIGIKTGKSPRGFWSAENTVLEARRIADLYGEEELSQVRLKAMGHGGLARAIQKNGGQDWILDKLGIRRDLKPAGYWTAERTIAEARKIVEAHGKEILTQNSLKKNGYSKLAGAIARNGGLSWIRNELRIEINRKPNGYYTVEKIINEARAIVLIHGEKCMTSTWLSRNGYSSLVNNIVKNGGFEWLRLELDLNAKTKPRGFWTREATILEARKIVKMHGAQAISQIWLQQQNNSGLATAITRNGGFYWIREELGITNHRAPRASQASLQRRAINLQYLRNVIRDLCLEGVKGFTPAQLVVVLQQAGFDKLPINEGKDLYLALTKGRLLPDELIIWSNGDKPEPLVAAGELDPTGDPVTLPIPEQITQESSNHYEAIHSEPGLSTHESWNSSPDELHQYLSPLAMMNPFDQLRFLDAEIFASADDEAIESLTSMGLHQLWAKAYLGSDQAEEVCKACNQFYARRPWSERLQKLFLEQYTKSTALLIPQEYNYRVDGSLVEPRLMQRHVAALALQRRKLLVMSDMGTGKSLAAQLAVISDGSKRILVIAINSCVDQWVYDFKERWFGNSVKLLDMDSIRSLTKDCEVELAGNDRTVWVIPSHLLSLMKDQEVAAVVEGLEPDAVIMDEIHIFKQREGVEESQRRQQTLKLLSVASDLKPELMVLGLSGTLITNSLNEGRTLLELVMGEERPDLPTGRGIAKAMRMHQALMANGIRQRASNDFPYVVERPEVDATEWLEDVQLALRYPPRLRPLQVEKALIHARIPAILKAIKGPTVIVTQYVEGFIEPLRKAIKAAGHRVGVHTGEEKLPVFGHDNAVEAFKAEALDVLLASINTISTGVDGLQNVSNNLVIACMPWTAADYLQVIARLARSGQEQPVRVVIPTTHINYVDDELGPAQWSFCAYRASIIACKQRLMDAVMDGLVPESEEITEAKAGQQLVRWLERLNTQGALVRPSRPIRVPLIFDTEEEETKARARFGTWSSCNGRWNSQASDRLHKRLQANPEEWELYHTDLDTLRKEWDVDPLQEAINHCLRSQGLVIGDFGCGTAKLADALEDRHTVHSFDHVAINDKVKPCDIAAGVPLPDESLDLAIFSLSLMGPNWKDQLVEARRCLKPTGQVLIWTASSNKDAAEFSEVVESTGFKVVTTQLNYKWHHVWAVCV
jgi:hypothetical protein